LPKLKEKKRALNNDIRATKVQLITDLGENLGEMSLTEAKALATEQGLDLMEI
jgi:translation initiation factor IF-3